MQKRKWLSLALACVLITAVLAACQSTPAPAPAPATQAPAQQPGDPAAPAAPTLDLGTYSKSNPLKIKLGNASTTTSHTQKLAEAFKEKIEAWTDGAVEITIYPDAVLGNDRASYDGIIAGTIDMAVNNTPIISNYAKEFQVLDLAFLFDDYAHMLKFLDSDVCAELMDTLIPTGGRFLCLQSVGMRCFMTTTKFNPDINSMRGVKFRITEGEYYKRAFEAWGAAPMSVASTEIIPALSTGALDGADHTPITLYTGGGQHEFIKWVTVSQHAAHFNGLTIHENLFQSLTKDMQDLFMKAAREAASERSALLEKENEEYLQMLIDDYDCKVSYDFEADPFIEAMQPIYDDFKANHPAGAFFDKIKALNK